jgi:hypothetical protein
MRSERVRENAVCAARLASSARFAAPVAAERSRNTNARRAVARRLRITVPMSAGARAPANSFVGTGRSRNAETLRIPLAPLDDVLLLSGTGISWSDGR